MSTSSTHWRVAVAVAAAVDGEAREARIAAAEAVAQQVAETARAAVIAVEAAAALRVVDIDDWDGARPRSPHGHRHVSPSPVRRHGRHHHRSSPQPVV
jgi:hypothetical protein